MALQYTPESFRAMINQWLKTEPETPWNAYFNSEAKFQRAVQRWAEGMPSPWKTYHVVTSQLSKPGFPDLHAVNPRCGCEIVAELKSMGTKADLSLEQASWVLAYALDPERHVFIWRPSDEDEILNWLQHHQDQFTFHKHAIK